MEQIFPLSDDCADQTLRFSITEDLVCNEFLRKGPVAVHLLLSSGRAPRLLAAFPAGNSATCVWFVPHAEPIHWGPLQEMRAVSSRDAKGRPLYGFDAEVEIDAASLTAHMAILSSARVVRDYQGDGRLAAGIDNLLEIAPDRAHWSRDRLDGTPGYAMALQALGGSVTADAHGQVTLSAAPGQTLRLRITALCGETPLKPMDLTRLLREPQAGARRVRESLAFLSYEDKLLAGSWRFNTYFGRDTLMSLLLLMPALMPDAVEAGLAAVLARLSAQGDVAHEEDIGECALLHGAGGTDCVLDYKMVDDDFMLAPVAAAYLLESPGGRARADRFLAHVGMGGRSNGAALCANLRLVLQRATAFAQRPALDTLIRLKTGQVTGDWRDSSDGLGGGTISYSVNAVLVPAALRAIAALAASGLLAHYLEPEADHAGGLADAWESHAPDFFCVRRSADNARDAILIHATELGIDAAAAVASLPSQSLQFYAIALADSGATIPVMHSDFGFALMLQRPAPDMIERELAAIMRPYPAGLMTGVGMVVANGAYGITDLRAMFGPDRYHGAVVWSWQQALLAAGLARQLTRADLPQSTRDCLSQAQSALWATITSTQSMSNSELWSWHWSDGVYHMRPFGSSCADADESNAAQLWSTVYLAVKPPG